MKGRTSYQTIIQCIPERIRQAMINIPENEQSNLCEIRFYSLRNVVYIYPGKIKFLSKNGKLIDRPVTDEIIIVDPADIIDIVDILSNFSLHSCTKELKEGYFMLEGGIRVGVAGTFSSSDSGVLKSFSSLNFRISRNINGCSEPIFNRIFGSNVIICGGVNSGKTTILRDLCRMTGNICKTALIDERNEIASISDSIPSNDVGLLTDIFVNTIRSDGINTAIRTMSPDYIFCDEISTDDDAEAILNGHGTGVKFAATIHAESYDDFIKRPVMNELLKAKAFEYAVILKGSGFPAQVKEIRRIKEIA